MVGDTFKFEIADWLAMYSNCTSHIALLVEHLTEWDSHDSNGVDWVCVASSVRALETQEVTDF